MANKAGKVSYHLQSLWDSWINLEIVNFTPAQLSIILNEIYKNMGVDSQPWPTSIFERT